MTNSNRTMKKTASDSDTTGTIQLGNRPRWTRRFPGETIGGGAASDLPGLKAGLFAAWEAAACDTGGGSGSGGPIAGGPIAGGPIAGGLTAGDWGAVT